MVESEWWCILEVVVVVVVVELVMMVIVRKHVKVPAEHGRMTRYCQIFSVDFEGILASYATIAPRLPRFPVIILSMFFFGCAHGDK